MMKNLVLAVTLCAAPLGISAMEKVSQHASLEKRSILETIKGLEVELSHYIESSEQKEASDFLRLKIFLEFAHDVLKEGMEGSLDKVILSESFFNSIVHRSEYPEIAACIARSQFTPVLVQLKNLRLRLEERARFAKAISDHFGSPEEHYTSKFVSGRMLRGEKDWEPYDNSIAERASLPSINELFSDLNCEKCGALKCTLSPHVQNAEKNSDVALRSELE